MRGKRYKFTGSKQRAIIRQLYEAWVSGEPERLTTEVLEIAGYRDSVNTLGKAFSGNRDWKTFIGEGRELDVRLTSPKRSRKSRPMGGFLRFGP